MQSERLERPEWSSRKQPKLKALPRVEMINSHDAKDILAELAQLRQRILAEFPQHVDETDSVNSSRRHGDHVVRSTGRTLQPPPLPGSVNDTAVDTAGVPLTEERIREIVRAEFFLLRGSGLDSASEKGSGVGSTAERSPLPRASSVDHRGHKSVAMAVSTEIGGRPAMKRTVSHRKTTHVIYDAEKDASLAKAPLSVCDEQSCESSSVQASSEWVGANGNKDGDATPVYKYNQDANLGAHTPTNEDLDTDAQEKRAEEDEEDDEGEEWVKVSGNAFGAFIHVGLQSGLWSAIVKTGPMVLASVMIQAIFSEELITQHIAAVESYSDGSMKRPRLANEICWVPVKLQMSAVIIFITLMFGNIPGMFCACRLAFESTHHKGGDGEDLGEMDSTTGRSVTSNHDMETAIPIRASMFRRSVIFVCAVASEIVSWGAIMLAGILFAVTAETVDLVIRSTVSVMFVLNIDEIVFEACCPSSIKDDCEETEYRLPRMKGSWILQSARMEHILGHYYGVYVHLPLLIGCSSAIVFVLRIFYLECPQHPVFQADHVRGLGPWPGVLPEASFAH